MGAISLEKSQHMYWLGRYTERVFTTLRAYLQYYDQMLDTEELQYQEFCTVLGIPDLYGSKEVFFHDYLFDEENPASITSSLNRAFDNAIVIRNEISSNSLSYIHLCMEILKHAEAAYEPMLELQKMIDYLYAFWGSLDDCAASEICRNILKVGRFHERLDLYLRLTYGSREIQKEYNKLRHQILASGMKYDQKILDEIGTMVADLDQLAENRQAILSCLLRLV